MANEEARFSSFGFPHRGQDGRLRVPGVRERKLKIV
jgi:hypothetical protein